MQAVRRQRHGVALPSAWGVGWGTAFFIRQGLRYALDAAQLLVAIDRLYAAPMFIPAGTKFDQAGLRFGTVAGTNVRLGLYASDPRTGGPGSLVLDFGIVAGAANSDVTTNIDLPIEETGIYWLALQEEGSLAGFNSPTQRGGGLFRGSVAGRIGAGYIVAGQPGGSLADPFPTATMVTAGPTFYMRVKDAPPPRLRLKRAQSIGTPMGLPGEACQFTGQLEPISPTMAVAADNIYAHPILIQEAVDIEGMAFNVSVSGVGNAYIGLYDGNADGYPRELLFDSAALTLVGIGQKLASCTLHLPPGLYWAAIQTDNAGAATLHARYPDGFLGFATTLNGQFPHLGLGAASVSAGMPASFPSGAASQRTAPSLLLNTGPFAISPIISGQGLPHRSHVDVAMPIAHHIYHAGWYVGPCSYQWAAVSVKEPHLDEASAISFVLDRETTFDQLWVGVGAVGGSGYNIEMGVYDETGWHFPGRLLVTTGPQARAAQTGIQAFSLDFTLPPGLYWLAVAIQGTGAATLDLEGAWPLAYRLGWTGDATPGAFVGQAFVGTLSDPWTGINTGTVPPIVGMRVKHYGAP